MKKLIVIVIIVLFVSLFVSTQEEELTKEEYAKGLIYLISGIRIEETKSPALQKAREKTMIKYVEREIVSFALRIKIDDFETKRSDISGSIEPEDIKVALKILVKPFYSFLEKEYKSNLELMLEECPGFSELLRLAERYSLTEDSSEEESNNDSSEEEIIVSPF